MLARTSLPHHARTRAQRLRATIDAAGAGGVADAHVHSPPSLRSFVALRVLMLRGHVCRYVHASGDSARVTYVCAAAADAAAPQTAARVDVGGAVTRAHFVQLLVVRALRRARTPLIATRRAAAHRRTWRRASSARPACA